MSVAIALVLFIEVSRSILYTREFNLDCIQAKHKFITLVRVSEMPSYSVLCCTKELQFFNCKIVLKNIYLYYKYLVNILIFI